MAAESGRYDRTRTGEAEGASPGLSGKAETADPFRSPERRLEGLAKVSAKGRRLGGARAGCFSSRSERASANEASAPAETKAKGRHGASRTRRSEVINSTAGDGRRFRQSRQRLTESARRDHGL